MIPDMALSYLTNFHDMLTNIYSAMGFWVRTELRRTARRRPTWLTVMTSDRQAMGRSFSHWLVIGGPLDSYLCARGDVLLRSASIAPVDRKTTQAAASSKGNPTISWNKGRTIHITIEIAKKELENALPLPLGIPGNSGHIPSICDTRQRQVKKQL
jgi:hypothetical protein